MKIKKGKTVFTIIGAIFFIIGMILVVIGGISLARTSAFMNSAQKTKAEIINISADSYRRNGKNHTHYDVWIEYTVDGEVLEKILMNIIQACMRAKKLKCITILMILQM